MIWVNISPTNILERDPRIFFMMSGAIFSNICVSKIFLINQENLNNFIINKLFIID
jgi:hypothetical protein